MSKKGFSNKRRQAYIEDTVINDIEGSNIASKCKFNFSFLDQNQAAGQALKEWAESTGSHSLLSLNEKLKHYSDFSLLHWTRETTGNGLHVLEVYGDFPRKSDFKEPRHIPGDVEWARFRLAAKVRLIGFIVPSKLDGKIIEDGRVSHRLDSNTFYIVFLDKDHKFYLTTKEKN